MYTTSHPASAPINGMGSDLIDGSGTINPAALNTPVTLAQSSLAAPSAPNTNTNANASPRGIKRSRSTERHDQPAEGEVEDVPDEQGRRKRGRPPKTPKMSTASHPAPSTASQRSKQSPAQPQVSHLPAQHIQHAAVAPQTSPPPKTTPTKPVVKALPTVRDHTTDQLGADGDEYLPKEFDENGEKKVDAMGYPQDKRKYKCRTFCVPNRGDKLFMLATECARVLGYRDSYLLFTKNRSLYKIIATQTEKDSLIQQDILPYSYRSRQIAIVTAKSMFRQFGSRVIVDGRRVRDDYWESKARKQGFTEEDLAGEKRPGAAKARDAAAAEAANAGLVPSLGQSDIIYSNGPHIDGIPPDMPPHPANLTPLPMIHLAPADDPRMREFNSMPRPRQEMAPSAFQDRTQPSTAAEIMNHATHTADFSKILNQQRGYRSKGLDEHWNRKREAPATNSQSPPGQVEPAPASAQSLQSPQLTSGMLNQHPGVLSHPQMMTPQQSYSQTSHQPTPISQSPLRGMPQGMRPDQLQHRSSNISLASAGTSQASPYPYSQTPQQLWGQPPPQPQPSPLSASHTVGMSQYPPQLHQQQQSPSPHLHNTPPHHPSQSPRHQHRAPPSQLHSQPPPQQQQQNLSAMGYPGVSAAAYSNMAAVRGMYPSSQGPAGSQQFMPAAHQQPGMGMATSAALPGWPSTTAGGPLPQGPTGQPQGGWQY